MRSNGLRDTWCLYQALAGQTTSFHHSAAVNEKICYDRSVLLTAANLQESEVLVVLPMEQEEPVWFQFLYYTHVVSRFLHSFLHLFHGIHHEGHEFQGLLGKASSSIIFGPLGAGGLFGVSAFYFGNVVSLQLQSLGVLQPPCGGLSLLLFPIGCGELRFFFL